MVYYGVTGSNSFGVYDDYNLILESRKYVKKYDIRKFERLYDAFKWAVDIYNSYQEGEDVDNVFYGNSNEIEINYLYYRREIREKNLEDYI